MADAEHLNMKTEIPDSSRLSVLGGRPEYQVFSNVKRSRPTLSIDTTEKSDHEL